MQIQEYLDDQASAPRPDRNTLAERQQELDKQQSNITRAIASIGGSDALLKELSRIEAELKHVEGELESLGHQRQTKFSFEEFKAFVDRRAAEILSVLAGDPVLAKQTLKKMIKHLVLTPIESPGGDVFEVTGDIDLFAGEHCVMPGGAVDRNTKHYTQLLSLNGLQLNPNKAAQASTTIEDVVIYPPSSIAGESPNATHPT